MKVLNVLVVVAVVVCLGIWANAAWATTYAMGGADPVAGGFSAGGFANSVRGWSFTCNTQITVTELGCFYPDGNVNPKTVVLWQVSPQQIIGEVTSTPGPGWCYTALPTPVTLTAGAEYIVVGHTVTASYYWRSGAPAAFYPNAEVSFITCMINNNCTPQTYPYAYGASYQYGIVDIGYTEGPEIVDPSPGSALPEATEGQTNYSVDFEASGGTAPYVWGGGASSLPAFLEFNPALGNPVQLVNTGPIGAAGTYTVDVEVEDAAGETALESYDLVVNPPPVLTGPPTLPGLTEGHGYLSPPTFSATGGTGALTWSLTGAPTGLMIVGAGVLNGPVDPGTAAGSPYSLTVTVEDANGVQDSLGPFTLTVNPEPAIDPVTPFGAPLGLPYNLAMTATGGTDPLTWSLSGDTGDFVIDANTGVLGGTPSTLGTFTFDVVVTDACNAMGTLSITIGVIDPPTAGAPTLPELTEGVTVPAGVAFTSTGGDPMSYVWSVAGTVPSGLSFDNVLQGTEYVYALTGAPTVGSAGDYPLDITVTDTSTTLTDTVSVTITVNAPPDINITGGLVLPSATGTGMWTHSFMAVADTGTSPLTWTLGTVTGPAAALPGITLTGDTLSSNAVGQPYGDYSFDVTVTDANGASDTETFTLSLMPPPELPTEFPYAQVGTAYSESLTVTAGTGVAPCTLAVTQDLPGILGMTVSIAGAHVTVEGTPIGGTAGQYEVQVNVTDANNVSTLATVAFVIAVKPSSSGCCGMTRVAGGDPRGLAWLVAIVLLAVFRRRFVH